MVVVVFVGLRGGWVFWRRLRFEVLACVCRGGHHRLVVVVGLGGLGIFALVTLPGASLRGRGGHHRLVLVVVLVGLGGGGWVFWCRLPCQVLACGAEVGTTGWCWWWGWGGVGYFGTGYFARY